MPWKDTDETMEELIVTSKRQISFKRGRPGEIKVENFPWLMKGYMCEDCLTVVAISDQIVGLGPTESIPKVIKEGGEINE